MLRLARLSIRHPVAALLICVVVAGGLVADRPRRHELAVAVDPTVPGTESSRAQHLAEAEFGPSVLVPILLEGPQGAARPPGPGARARRSRARADTRVLSAWDAGTAGAGLRPRPTAAMIVASVAHTEKEMVKTDQAQIERLVARARSAAPCTPRSPASRASTARCKDESIDTTRTAWRC